MNLLQIYRASFTGLTKDVYILGGMMLINRVGTLILPFLTLYTTQQLGWTEVDAGTATMWFGIGSLCGAYLGGILTDRIGYYKTMAIGLFAGALFFYAAQYFTKFYALCGMLFLGSMFADLLRPALFAGINMCTDESNRTRSVSLMRMAFNLGFVLGPAIAGVFIEKYGYRSIFVLDSLTCFMAGIYLLVYVPDLEDKIDRVKNENKENSVASSQVYKDVPFLLFLFFSCVMLISFFQLLSTVPLYLKTVLGLSPKEIGWYFYGFNGLLVFLLEMPMVKWIETRTTHFGAMIVGSILIGLGYLIWLIPAGGMILMVAFVILLSMGEIVNFPFISTTSMKRAPKGMYGKYMGLTSMMFSFAILSSPKIGTLILDAIGYQGLFGVIGGLCIFSTLGLHWVKRYFI